MTDLHPAEHSAEHLAQRAVRQAVLDLAGEGRPVNLGQAALRGVRRQRVRTVAASAVAVAAVIAAVALWPGWTHRIAVPPADPSPTVSYTTWPPFRGLGLVPSPPWGEAALPTAEAARRMVIAAYQTEERHLFVLDPTTLTHRRAPATIVEAVSPDLRYTLIGREQHSVDPNEGLGLEYGIYDTVAGRVLGRLDLTPYAAEGSFDGFGAAWSPDGSALVIPLREHRPGPGFVIRTLVIVDVRTGTSRSVAVQTAAGLEPEALVGWAYDRQRLIFEADPVGTDLAPTGHLLVDAETGTSAGIIWPTQGQLLTGPATDEVAMITIDDDSVLVLNQVTGEVLREYPPFPRAGQVTPLAWRGSELVAKYQECDPQFVRCGQARVLGLDPTGGPERVLAVTGESAPWVYLAPANGAVPMDSSW